jgi:hypothetical protein
MMICAGLLVVGAVIALIGIPGRVPKRVHSPVRAHCSFTGPPVHPVHSASG